MHNKTPNLKPFGIACIATFSLCCLSFNDLATPSVANASTNTSQKVNSKKTTPPATVKWNFQDADIRAVINTVAKLTGNNFVIDPRVQGKVSFISNHPMTLTEAYQAFLSMLRVLNYTALPTGNITKIIPIMDARNMGLPISTKKMGYGDNMVLRVISLKHTNATDLLPILQPFISPYGNIRAYAPANSLMVAGSATNINHIMQMIQQLDQTQSSSISVVSLQHSTADKLAQAITQLQKNNKASSLSNVSIVADDQSNSILLTGDKESRDSMTQLIHRLDTRVGANQGSGAEVISLNYLNADDIAKTISKTISNDKDKKSPFPVTIEAEKTTNSLIISGPIDQRQNIISVIKKLDTRPKQVLVEAIIAEVDAKLVSQLGIQWGAEATSSSTDGSNPVMSFAQGLGVIPKTKLAGILNFLASDTSTNILATPIISVLNNQKASIADGEDISVSNRTYDSNTSTSGDYTPFTTSEYKNVGLTLNVTPRISPNDVVSLKIKQKNDSLADARKATENPLDNSNPAITTSSLQTSVMVKSGDILVMGGLIKKDRQGNIQRVPILGDLPLLGKLFQYHDHSGERKDLMVFIRPVIIRNGRDTKRLTSLRYNIVRAEQLRQNSNLPLKPMESMPLLKNRFHQHKAALPNPFSS